MRATAQNNGYEVRRSGRVGVFVLIERVGVTNGDEMLFLKWLKVVALQVSAEASCVPLTLVDFHLLV